MGRRVTRRRKMKLWEEEVVVGVREVEVEGGRGGGREGKEVSGKGGRGEGNSTIE